MRDLVPQSICLLLMFMTIACFANPIQSPDNGHWYEFVGEPLLWPDAQDAAQAMTWMGLAGHLATITNQAEFDFISTQIPSLQEHGCFLGGYQDPSYCLPDENWFWVTDEPWDYTNWSPGEPNDHLGYGSEPYLGFRPDTLPPGLVDLGDLGPDYYLVEYDASTPVYWPGNGHWYQFICDPQTWPDAQDAAQTMTWMGLTGYLATITSQAEFDFIATQVPSLEFYGCFLGGYQDPAYCLPDENWHWVTDEPWNYTNWSPGEPNDHMGYGSEPYLGFRPDTLPPGLVDLGALGPDYYLVEYSLEVVKNSDTQTTWSHMKKLFRDE